MNNLKQLQKIANSVVALQTEGKCVDFTQTDLIIKTDFGNITYQRDNKILLSPKGQKETFNLIELNNKKKLLFA